jgi:hypothetical protein
LLNRAIGLGLLSAVALTADQQAEIRRANDYYTCKVFEYFDLWETVTGYRQKPDLKILQATAEALVKDLERACLDATNDV